MKEKFSATKLLTIVLCLQLASVAIAMIDSLFYNDAWLGWIRRGITVAVIVCFFWLHKENRLYRWTAVLKAVALGLMLLGLFFSNNYVIYGFDKYLGITWEDLFAISSVVYWLKVAATLPALVLEYLSHGKIAPAIRKGWIGLMIAQLAWVVIGNGINQITAEQFEAQRWGREMLEVYRGGVQLVNLVMQMFYLWLLFRTARAVKEKESV